MPAVQRTVSRGLGRGSRAVMVSNPYRQTVGAIGAVLAVCPGRAGRPGGQLNIFKVGFCGIGFLGFCLADGGLKFPVNSYELLGESGNRILTNRTYGKGRTVDRAVHRQGYFTDGLSAILRKSQATDRHNPHFGIIFHGGGIS